MIHIQTRAYESGDPSKQGYRHAEARQRAEFCVGLENQDGRPAQMENAEFRVNIDPASIPRHTPFLVVMR